VVVVICLARNDRAQGAGERSRTECCRVQDDVSIHQLLVGEDHVIALSAWPELRRRLL
jgi:hypothetical protein